MKGGKDENNEARTRGRHRSGRYYGLGGRFGKELER